MSKFGEVAVRAVELYRTKGNISPLAAWDAAGHELLATKSLREKNCPRATYLSLCQEGLIVGVPKGQYTRARENREYAIEAVRHLVLDPGLVARGPIHLWQLVTGGAEIEYNDEMHVVLTLWNRGLITVDRGSSFSSEFDDDELYWYKREHDPAFIASIAEAREHVAQRKTITHEELKKRLGID